MAPDLKHQLCDLQYQSSGISFRAKLTFKWIMSSSTKIKDAQSFKIDFFKTSQ